MVLGQFTQDNSGSFVIQPPKIARRAGRVISGAVILLLLQDALVKVLNLDFVRTARAKEVWRPGDSANIWRPDFSVNHGRWHCTVLHCIRRRGLTRLCLAT